MAEGHTGMTVLRVACVQLSSSDDVAANVAAASLLIRQAHRDGAQFVLTPEMTSFMDVRPGALQAKTQSETSHEALEAFQALARELSLWLLIGSMSTLVQNGKCANRSFLIAPSGEIAARYDKIHMFDVDIGDGQTYRESDSYQPGRNAVVADLPNARLGMTVCYDVRFGQLFRRLAQAGAEILCVPAAFTKLSGAAHWHVLLRARAIENGAFVMAAGQCGTHPDGRQTYGHSLIIGPWGEIIAEAGDEPCVIMADLDLGEVAAARGRIPALRHDRDYALPS
jgi:deaminated glutathione amidase